MTDSEREELKMKHRLSMYRDDWYFDIGANIAFTQIIYTIILIYSQVAPLITIFGTLYFTFKYLIDKYNLLYVYEREYDGRGRLYQNIVKYQYWSMAFSQFIMYGLLVAIFGPQYKIVTMFIAGLQILLLLLYRCVSLCPKTYAKIKKWLGEGYMTED